MQDWLAIVVGLMTGTLVAAVGLRLWGNMEDQLEATLPKLSDKDLPDIETDEFWSPEIDDVEENFSEPLVQRVDEPHTLVGAGLAVVTRPTRQKIVTATNERP